MKIHRIILAALVLAVVAPAVAEAQGFVRVTRRGMLGFASEVIEGRSGRTERVVVDVVQGSPAERAGVVAGDTLISFNGVQPSTRLPSFEPGDTVVLRLRRNGRERDVRLVATERTTSFEVLPDSIRSAIAIMIDGVRADIDTIRFPRMRVEKLHGDSAIVYFGNDRVLVFPHDFERALPLDSIRSLMLHGAHEMRDLFRDSTHFRFWSDTTDGMIRRGGRFRINVDSANFQIFTARPGQRAFTYFHGDSAHFMRPGEMLRSGYTIGMRAIAGAELAELNPGLGEYFGTLEGVLVLNAADGTPAARAGLRSGDVITRANGQEVTTITTLRRIVDRAPPGSTIRLEVLRRGTRSSVELSRQ
jgi:membrane-associated protease RseP (regulator of RpoE activity)